MDGVERRLRQRFGRRVAVLRQQFPLERAAVDADPKRDVSFPYGLDHLLHLPPGPDVAGVDADTVHNLRGLKRQPVIEVNIRDQRNGGLLPDGRQRLGCLRRVHRHPDQLAPGLFQQENLRDRRLDVRRVRRRHGLDDHRRAAADGYPSHSNLLRLAPFDEHAQNRSSICTPASKALASS